MPGQQTAGFGIMYYFYFKVYHLKAVTILTAGWGGIGWKRSTQLEEQKLIDRSLDASYNTALVQWVLLLNNTWTKYQIINLVINNSFTIL